MEKRNVCEECGGKLGLQKTEFKLYGEVVGIFPAEVCMKCGEEVFDEKTSTLIDAAAKRKGLWGLGANAKVTKVGSSLALIVNKKIADFLELEQGKEVYISPESKRKFSVEVQ